MTDLSPRFRWQLGLRDSLTLSKAAKLVGFVRSFHMDADGRSCRVGVRRLAEETGMTTDTVTKADAELIAAGWLTVLAGAVGTRPREVAATLDGVPPTRTQDGSSVPPIRTQTDPLASDFSPSSVRNDGTKGLRVRTSTPKPPPPPETNPKRNPRADGTNPRAQKKAEAKRDAGRALARNVGHQYEPDALRDELEKHDLPLNEINQLLAKARNELRRASVDPVELRGDLGTAAIPVTSSPKFSDLVQFVQATHSW